MTGTPDSHAARTLFQLPDGEQTWLTGDEHDLSVFGAIRAQNGVWEPHLTRLFSLIVQPDSICLDIGANIGAQSLVLARLAPRGRVWAVEASEKNHARLLENLAALPRPHAEMTAIRTMIWDDSPARPLASVREVAGCSFITAAEGHDAAEQQVRAQVSAEALAGVNLNLSFEHPPATTLDALADEAGWTRLDLIKMDIEGSEGRALSGGMGMLKRLRPVLVTEYNPRCAVVYWDEPRDAYYRQLASLYGDIRVVAEDRLIPVSDWSELDAALATSPGWLDLCCSGFRE